MKHDYIVDISYLPIEDTIDITFIVVDPDEYKKDKTLIMNIVKERETTVSPDEYINEYSNKAKEEELNIVTLLNSFGDFDYFLKILKTTILTNQYDYVDLVINVLYTDEWFSKTFERLESLKEDRDGNLSQISSLYDTYLYKLKLMNKDIEQIKELSMQLFPVIGRISNLLNKISTLRKKLKTELIMLHWGRKVLEISNNE